MNGKKIKHENALCLDADCIYRKECANHESAGDYRMEDGLRPKFNYNEKTDELFCVTAQTEPLPLEDDLGRGADIWPKEHHLQGFAGFPLYLFRKSEEEIGDELSKLLNVCLEEGHMKWKFRVIKTDLKDKQFVVEFDIGDIEPLLEVNLNDSKGR